jgi:hypothetical protein
LMIPSDMLGIFAFSQVTLVKSLFPNGVFTPFEIHHSPYLDLPQHVI